MDLRNVALAAGSTVLAALVGLWVAAFDPEIGMVPKPNARTHRIDGPTPYASTSATSPGTRPASRASNHRGATA